MNLVFINKRCEYIVWCEYIDPELQAMSDTPSFASIPGVAMNANLSLSFSIKHIRRMGGWGHNGIFSMSYAAPITTKSLIN